jgi:hypothetical protein
MACAKRAMFGEGELDVEEALVEQLSRRAVGYGAWIGELGVDHQGGLIEPDELAVQAAVVPRGMPGVVEQLKRQGGHFARPGGERALGALQGLGLAGVEESEPDAEGDDDADADLGGEPA